MSDKHKKILRFIRSVRNVHNRMEEVFLHGACLRFHQMLDSAFGGEPWYGDGHVITRIDDRFYDIQGVVSKKRVKENEYEPLSKHAYRKREMKQLWKTEHNTYE